MNHLDRLIARALALRSLVIVATVAIVAFLCTPALADGVAGAGALGFLDMLPIPVLIGLVGTVIVAIVLPLTFAKLSRPTQDKILAATKGLYYVVAEVSKHTATPLDDALALLLQKVEEEMGRELKPEEALRVKNIALAMHADPAHPNLGSPSPAELIRAINIPRA
jgi:hypothetical protein